MDRDGVVNVLLVNDYAKRIEELALREDFLRSIPLIASKFTRVIIVTNQQGISKGICTKEQVEAVHAYLLNILAERGLLIDRIYVCPHLAGSGCHCRKPETGMAEEAVKDFPDINLSESVMVGDSVSDMIFGRRCGMRTVFIGSVTEENHTEILANSDHVVTSLYEFLKTY